MSSIKKQVLVNGQAHFIEVNSSLELEEVEITGMDPTSGKVVQVSLSPLLKPTPRPFDSNPFSASSPPTPAYTAPFSSPPPSWPSFGESSPPSNSPPSWQDSPAPPALQMFDSPPQMDMFSEPSQTITPPLSQNAPPAWPPASASPPPFGTPAAESAPLSPPPFSEAPQGLAGVRQKSEKEEVDDTLNGMYRY
jgi:hypothetical protein